MRLIVHMGFHKTASTHLQDLMNRNQARIAERGIWYQPEPGYPAHHGAANPLLVGDTAPFEAMIADARAAGCHTMIFSSENLEGLVFNASIAALLEETAAAKGVTEIEWHAVIREPGAYFESIHPQLSWHTYADGLHMFAEVMKKGVLFLPEPHPGDDATPYWFFCFDYLPFLSAFAEGRALFVHDFADRSPYPGWRMIERLGLLDSMVEQAQGDGLNHRLPPDRVAKFFRKRLREAAGDHATWAMVREAVRAHMAANLATVPVYAKAVGERYGESYRQALAVFGPETWERRAAA
ncbi:hypothetical protein OF829_07145 [Sphingomonas sp. LB-2]|uniref:hypothetical protein n=1 Tax=Sphingomonas caeni TaxID=2984949 RepID=UPI0022305170|nr:hypothetical protein [Sphingomonas caeni]MCW3847011.1 hypothetical protein [Sphingomonas caeni]